MGSPTAWKIERPRPVAVLIPECNICEICYCACSSYFRGNFWKSLIGHFPDFLDVGFGGGLTLVPYGPSGPNGDNKLLTWLSPLMYVRTTMTQVLEFFKSDWTFGLDKIHGIPWNLECAYCDGTSSSMELRYWNYDIELPWNSMEFEVRQFRWHGQFHGIPWNSMGLELRQFRCSLPLRSGRNYVVMLWNKSVVILFFLALTALFFWRTMWYKII